MRYWRKPSKYHAIKTRCNQDHKHDSHFEAGYCNRLAMLLAAHEIKEYTAHPRLKMELGGQHICYYIPDFLVVKDGSYEIHETKGMWTADARLKWKLAKVFYPDYIFIEVRGRIKHHGRTISNNAGIQSGT